MSAFIGFINYNELFLLSYTRLCMVLQLIKLIKIPRTIFSASFSLETIPNKPRVLFVLIFDRMDNELNLVRQHLLLISIQLTKAPIRNPSDYTNLVSDLIQVLLYVTQDKIGNNQQVPRQYQPGQYQPNPG